MPAIIVSGGLVEIFPYPDTKPPTGTFSVHTNNTSTVSPSSDPTVAGVVDSGQTTMSAGKDRTGAIVTGQTQLNNLNAPRTLLYVEMSVAVNAPLYANDNACFIALDSGATSLITPHETSWSIMGGLAESIPEPGLTAVKGAAVNITKYDNAFFHDTVYNPAFVQNLLVGFRLVGKGYQGTFINIGRLIPFTITGGTVPVPATFDAIRQFVSNQKNQSISSPTENIHGCRTAWICGDGVTETHFTDTLKTWEFYGDANFSENIVAQSHIFDNDIGFELNSSALDTASYTLCNWIGTTPFFWNLIGSTSATATFDTCIVKGAGDVTIIDNRTFDFCTFDNCGELGVANPVMTNTTIKNSAATRALNLVTTGSMSGMTFDSNTTAMVFDFPGSASVSLNDFTFTNNTTDIEYTGDGVLTITPTNGTVVGTTLASGTGTISVVSAGSSITFTGIPAGAEYRLYEKDVTQGTIGTVELVGAEVHAGGDVVYAFSSGAGNIAILQVMASGFEEYLFEFALPSNPTTLPVTLEPETNL